MVNTLIIAAHPDDDILGCGGYIAKNSRYENIKVIFIAEGTSCRYTEINTPEVTEEINFRNTCGKKALNYLGVEDIEFFDLPCGRLDSTPIIEINKIIESIIREFKPNKIFTHAKNDLNRDHRIIYESTMMASRPIAFNFITDIFSFEILSSSELNYARQFCPNYFVELTHEQIERKWKALEFYDSEIAEYPHPRSREGLYNLSKQRGLQVARHYAEAYELIRKLEC